MAQTPATTGVSPEQARALAAFVNLLRAATAVSARVHAPLEALGLTVGQFGVLEALAHVGPLRAYELAAKVLSSPGNLTVVLKNLKKRRLIRRRPVRADRRGVEVDLTPRGRRLVDELFPAHATRLAAEFAVLTAPEQDELRRLCRRLGRRGA